MDGWDDDEDREDDRPVRRADAVLRLLVDDLRRQATGRRLDRIDRAEGDLRRCIAASVDRLFTDPERALVPLEEQFEPEGAAVRVASAEVVLIVLPVFLGEARWHGADVEDRRVRIQLAAAITRGAVRLPDLQGEVACFVIEAQQAIRRARDELRRATVPGS